MPRIFSTASRPLPGCDHFVTRDGQLRGHALLCDQEARAALPRALPRRGYLRREWAISRLREREGLDLEPYRE
jgi:hypothetical protein